MGQMARPLVKQVFKSIQFTPSLPDPEKTKIREQLWADPEMPMWRRRKLEQRLAGVDRWDPKRRLGELQIKLIRDLNAENPEIHSIEQLSRRFRISYEAIRRILKSA